MTGWPQLATSIGGVVCISTADWSLPLWTNKQHLMSRLGAEIPVLYVESLGLREPRLTPADLRRMWARLAGNSSAAPAPALRQPPAHLSIASPVVIPLHRFRAARSANRRLLERSLGAPTEALPPPRVLWAYNPLVIDAIDLRRFDAVLYHCVDDLASLPGIPARIVRDAERRFAARADVVVASSPQLVDQLRPYAPDVQLLPNVADHDHFSTATKPGPIPADLEAISGPRAVFVGSLSDYKLDWPLLDAVTAQRPDWNFVFIGPEGGEQAMTGSTPLRARSNCHFLGPRPYADLPDYLRGATVGLVPYRRSTHTAGIFPMKVWEYLGASLPVVATPLDALVRVGAPVHLAATPAEYSAALDAAAALSGEARRALTISAAKHTWDTNLTAMLAQLVAVLHQGD